MTGSLATSYCPTHGGKSISVYWRSTARADGKNRGTSRGVVSIYSIAAGAQKFFFSRRAGVDRMGSYRYRSRSHR
jgi:hypothetical protein